jgi:transposase
MKHYVGMDLHSSNTYVGILDFNEKRIKSKRIQNKLSLILEYIEPFRDSIEGIVVESTFNWYWLVDGLSEAGYKVHLGHPGAFNQYSGKKYVDDKHSAFFLARLLRLNILPEGHIFPKEERHLRDLLRKRLMLVQNSTQHILCFKSLVNRNLSLYMSSSSIKNLKPDDVDPMFENQHLALSAKANISMMNDIKIKVKRIEKEVLSTAKLKPEFQILLTAPGIGNILALTISLETGNINRFKKPGNFSSYCRCVGSIKSSNNKKKGKNNTKNGNKYLAWAFYEAAIKMIKYCPEASIFYLKKSKKTKGIVAMKALAHKISKACYFMMKLNVNFDINRIFNAPIKNINKGWSSKPEPGLDPEPKFPIGYTAPSNP